MEGRPDLDWRNHPHWDHGASDAAPTLADRFLAALEPRLRRAHLPRHPGSSLLLIALGTCHFMLFGGAVADLAGVALGSNRALLVLAWVLLAVMVLPGLWLVLAGTWDLARGPLRFFAPRWFRRTPPSG